MLKTKLTSLPVYTIVIDNFHHHMHHTPPQSHITPGTNISPSALTTLLLTTVNDQTRIGWQYCLQGYLSKYWSLAQQYCYIQCTDIDIRKYTIRCCRNLLLRPVIEGCIKCWDTRKTMLHGKTTKDSAQIRLRKLKASVAKSYTNNQLSVPIKHRALFNMILQDKLKHRSTTFHKWLETIQAAKKKP